MSPILSQVSLYLQAILITVPFEEDDKDPSVWFLDHTYIEEMNTMFKKINGTSPSLYYADCSP